jgi:histidinol phosphatase-like PHP family hydrolase
MKAEELIDLHIHTSYSDGYSTPLSVIETAITKKLRKICITDHYSYFKPALNSIDGLRNYYHDITELNRKFDQIDVSVGIEVDLLSINSLENLNTIPWDLILFEYVFASWNWEETFKNIIKFKQICKSDFNIGLAHTRFSRVTHSKAEQIFKSIRENEIIIELNTRYRNYKDSWFSYLDDQNWFSIGSDAHSLEQIGDVNGALSFLYDRDIPVNRIIRL